jgi:hypothetical protein
LYSVAGDADLFVSFDTPNPNKGNNTYESRRNNYLDEVIIHEETTSSNILNRQIFFSVYGNTRSQFRIEFEYNFKHTYNGRLDGALALGDGASLYQDLKDETEEGFYSYSPWWSKRENRTIVFLADVIFNKVFFYSAWNDYPKHYLTTLHDVNDFITIYGDDRGVNKGMYHHNGIYYIRLRPDFALYDLVSDR